MSTVTHTMPAGMGISWMARGPSGDNGLGLNGDVGQPDPNGLARLEAGRSSQPDPSDQVPPARVINEGDESKAFTAAKYIHGIAEFSSLADVQIVDWFLHDTESPLDSVRFRSSGKPRWWSGGPLKKFARRVLKGIEGDQSHIVNAKARYVVDRYMSSRKPVIYSAETLQSKLLAHPEEVLGFEVPTTKQKPYAFEDVDSFVSHAVKDDIQSNPAARRAIVTMAIAAMDAIPSYEKERAVTLMMRSFKDPESPIHNLTFVRGYFSALVFDDVPVYIERIKQQYAARLRRGLREHVLMPMLVRGLRAEEIDMSQLAEVFGVQAVDGERPFDFVDRVCQPYCAELHAFGFLASEHNLTEPDRVPFGTLHPAKKTHSMRAEFKVVPDVLEPVRSVIGEGLAHVAVQHLWPEASLEDREDLVARMMSRKNLLRAALGITVQEDGVEVPDSLRRPIVEERDSVRKNRSMSARFGELAQIIPALLPGREADRVADELFAVHENERDRRHKTLPLIEQLVTRGALTSQTPNLYTYADRLLGGMEKEYSVLGSDYHDQPAGELNITEGNADEYLKVYKELSNLFQLGSEGLIEHAQDMPADFIGQVMCNHLYDYLKRYNLLAFMVVAPKLGEAGRRIVESAIEMLNGILDGSAIDGDYDYTEEEDKDLIRNSITTLRGLL